MPAAKAIIVGPPLAEETGLGALTLPGYLQEVCTRYADNEALVLHEDGAVVRWSYRDLWDRAMEVARALVACGVGKGERVGVLMTNRPEFLSCFFGIGLAGGVATPLSTFSTKPELEYLLQASACSVLLLERKVLNKDFATMACELDDAIADGAPGEIASVKFPFLRHVVALGAAESAGGVEHWQGFLTRGAEVSPELVNARAGAATPADVGALFFSSGSSGKPKGILSAHRGVALQLWRFRKSYRVADDVRAWSANGFFFSGNFCMALGNALSSGGAMVLQKTFDPEGALALMDKEQATMAIAWPHQWPQLESAPNWASVNLSAMRYLDRTMPLAKHPTISVDWREPHAAYGNTEMFTVATVFPANTPESEIAGSHGRPVPGNVIKIVDPLSGEAVQVGQRGEIAVKGPTLMLGYLGVTIDETFDAEGFFHTGDGGYVDDSGRLYWEGRLSDIIKTGGANVSPLEVDAVLRDCPGVSMTQTVGVPHETLGEIVVACIVKQDGAALDEETVRAFAKTQLASYKTPRRVLFFAENELQLTGSAKIKSADLRVLAAKRLADGG